MKLLTAELRARLPALYTQEKIKDPVVHIKFFTPDSNWTWYATEGQADEGRLPLLWLCLWPRGGMGLLCTLRTGVSKRPLGPSDRARSLLPASPVQPGKGGKVKPGRLTAGYNPRGQLIAVLFTFTEILAAPTCFPACCHVKTVLRCQSRSFSMISVSEIGAYSHKEFSYVQRTEA